MTSPRQHHPGLWPLLAASVALLASALSAAAQPRVFVSAQTGIDTNPCSVTSPCRTFGQALSVVASGGEVIVLDSGGYGPVTINKPVTIEAPPGIYAGINTPAGSNPSVGINVSAGVGTSVVLRGLTFNGAGGINTFLILIGDGLLTVDRCVFNGPADDGIFFNTASTHGSLVITHSLFRRTGTAVEANGNASVTVVECRFEDNVLNGLSLSSVTTASIRNSVMARNNIGVVSYANGTPSELDVDECLIANNTIAGVQAQGTETIRVSNSTVADNGQALSTLNTSTIETFGNNRLRGNTSPNSGTIVLVSPN